ncbi:membrane transport protein-domain-containing protein [Lobosporangium transversale]|uniref:Membrane transport protein-domain-containing protein n=1 Tax=Lobosporangium transversale TaxID=64571 RepID=A0A1Y2GFD3_9FUNG|nr:membrane transport protein-domain-containing protein [Lobosporangium transversale]ORZ09352.1 membrane transport protein-domain-containing protein [Lobosporangium transversale]|eukprot:XP_021878805.1 membrane transport protein-domain-containing protein [Lobosporangium transversale]
MTPCLLFTKIASTITWEQFKAFWPIPVFYLIFSGVSLIVARIGSRFLRFSSDEEKFVKASILFSNTNSLPMALLQSLALSAAGSQLFRDEKDTKEQVAARGISYILFYAIFGNLVRWSYGFTLLVPKDHGKQQEQVELLDTDQVHEADHRQLEQPESNMESGGLLINMDGTLLGSSSNNAILSSGSSIRTLHEGYMDNNMEEDGGDGHSTVFQSKYWPKNSSSTHTQLHLPSIPGTVKRFSLAWGTRKIQHCHRRRSTKTMLKQKATTVFDRIQQVLTPPLLTAIIALVIGLVPALHELFMSPESKIYAFVIHPIEGCGAAAIPMILLCLGAQVVQFAASSDSSEEPIRPAQLQRRRSASTPSIFPNGYQGDDSGSSTEEEEDHRGRNGEPEWLRVHVPHLTDPGHRDGYGQNGIGSTRSHASSATTLLQPDNFEEDEEDEIPPLGSHITFYNDSTELSLMGHRFKWLTPVAFSLVARMLIVPLICLPAIIFRPASLSPVLMMDPTFTLTLVLIVAAPTAINIIQLCQIKGFFENDMAAVLFWSYCVWGIPCVLGWSLVGLWAAK